MRSSLFSAAALLAVAQMVTGQTHTDCDPTKKSCPSDKALGKTVTVDFTQGASKEFRELPGTKLTYGPDGAEFIIATPKQAPTIESNWYIFFGRVEVVMKAAPGVGIVSSFVLESDDLDEVDWEWLGADTAEVQSNYYGKGDTTTYDRGGFHPVNNPQGEFHTYTFDWTAERLTWAIDGAVVRTLLYNDAKGGTRYPQTPMNVKIGNWDAGAPDSPEGTVQWAGGYTDFTAGQKYTMVVKSVTITDGHPGAGSYSYGDMSGSWQSIVVSEGDGQEFNENTSSSTTKPTSTKATSTKASSTSTKASSTSTKASSSTMTTVTSSSSEVSTTDAPTATETDNTTPSSTGPPAQTSSGAASSLGANLAMVGAVVAFFAL